MPIEEIFKRQKLELNKRNLKRKYIEGKILKIIKKVADNYPDKFEEWTEQQYRRGRNMNHIVYMVYLYTQRKPIQDGLLELSVNKMYGNEEEYLDYNVQYMDYDELELAFHN